MISMELEYVAQIRLLTSTNADMYNNTQTELVLLLKVMTSLLP
jgi:hypothetical protein